MRAVGNRQSLPIDSPEAPIDIDPPIRRRASAIRRARSRRSQSIRSTSNTARVSRRRPARSRFRAGTPPTWGARSAAIMLFKARDRGSIARSDTSARRHLVDERIVARMPSTLTFPQAAAAPRGRVAPIDDPTTLDATPFKRKSLSLHRELMFTRRNHRRGESPSRPRVHRKRTEPGRDRVGGFRA